MLYVAVACLVILALSTELGCVLAIIALGLGAIVLVLGALGLGAMALGPDATVVIIGGGMIWLVYHIATSPPRQIDPPHVPAKPLEAPASEQQAGPWDDTH